MPSAKVKKNGVWVPTESVVVDSNLSVDSARPIQNKAVAKAINEITPRKIGALPAHFTPFGIYSVSEEGIPTKMLNPFTSSSDSSGEMTLEFFDGKPVYVRLFNCGTAVNGKQVAIGSVNPIRTAGILVKDDVYCTIPYRSSQDTWRADVAVYKGYDVGMMLACTANFGDGTYTWYQQVWYVL